jgi:hypothetical protein
VTAAAVRSPGAELVQAYEQMRSQQRGPGYEMVRRWGLVGWMERAAPFVPLSYSPSLPTRNLSSPTLEGVATQDPVSKSLYPALTQLLADVAMDWLREERS